MNKEEKISFKAAEILIQLKCINFSPKKQFKLTSGKKSPIYCDCRRLISFPKERDLLIKFSVDKIKKFIDFKKINIIAGGESAGIPFASFISSKLKLPMIYLKKEKKKFGKNSQIEGVFKTNDKILLVEDLMTDGGSKFKFFEAINDAKCKNLGLFIIFNYGILDKYLPFKKNKIKLTYLTDWNYVLKVASKKEILSDNEIIIIKDFLTSLGVKS